MTRILALVLSFVALLIACAPQDASIRGQRLYDNHCAGCHGASAQGDGPLAATVGMQAPNLTDLNQRNGGTFPMDDVIAQIHGYSGRYLHGGMPEYDKVLDSPMVNWRTQDGDVIPTPQNIIDIARYLQEIQT